MNRDLFKFATPPTPEQKRIASSFYGIARMYHPNVNRNALGYGTYSVVFPLGNNLSVKVSRLKFQDTRNTNINNKKLRFEAEITRTVTASNLNVGPVFKKGIVHRTDTDVFLVLVTEKLYPITPSLDIEKLYELVRKLKVSGLCHGDIHPGNLMMNSKGEYKFIDFATPERTNRCSNNSKLMEYFGVSVTPPGSPIGSPIGSPVSKSNVYTTPPRAPSKARRRI
jgi:serine/threonine protein kinase